MECSVESIPIEKSDIIARLNNGWVLFCQDPRSLCGSHEAQTNRAKAKNRVAARPRMREPNLIPA